MKLSELPKPDEGEKLPLNIKVPSGKGVCLSVLAHLGILGWVWASGHNPPKWLPDWVPNEGYIQLDIGGSLTCSQLDYYMTEWRNETIIIDSVANFTYCSCESPNIVWNSTLGKKFQYCRKCRKERQ